MTDDGEVWMRASAELVDACKQAVERRAGRVVTREYAMEQVVNFGAYAVQDDGVFRMMREPVDEIMACVFELHGRDGCQRVLALMAANKRKVLPPPPGSATH